MRIFLVIVFLILTALYGFQLWYTHRPAAPPVVPQSEVAGGVPAPTPGPPDLTPQRLALEKALSGVRISSVIGGARPMAQIAGRSYQVGDAIVVPGPVEPVNIRAIGDGFVVYGTTYHPEGFRVDLTREQLRTAP